MDGLRPRKRLVFSGFTKAEDDCKHHHVVIHISMVACTFILCGIILNENLAPELRLVMCEHRVEKMERLLEESEKPLNREIFKKIARSFSLSAGRAGKPIVKWTEVESWFKNKQIDCPPKVVSSTNASKADPPIPATSPLNEAKESKQTAKGEKIPDLSEFEFEARSSKDGAWYDVDMFLSHRYLATGEAEVRVRYVGFGAEEDEWVNVKTAVRERSIPLEHSECHKVKVGDLVCCFQESKDHANYYDAHVVDVQRKMHDIRGCRCVFLIRYNHNNTEERVRLRRLCRRPTTY